jgi:ABC-type lipoprotein export system ATPase subunit
MIGSNAPIIRLEGVKKVFHTDELHRSGTTIVMVTHNPEYARQAQRTIRLFDGRIVEESHHAQPVQ